jgi:hypothetical protein
MVVGYGQLELAEVGMEYYKEIVYVGKLIAIFGLL